MSPFEDVDSDSDELLDWLWDLPEGYDVGFEETLATGPEPATASMSLAGGANLGGPVRSGGIKKHLRRAEDHAAEPFPVTAAHEAMATEDHPSLDTEAYAGGEWSEARDDAVVGVAASEKESRDPRAWVPPPARRFDRRGITAVAAMLAVVAIGAGVGIALSRPGGKHPKPSNVAIGAPSTTSFATTSVDQAAAPTGQTSVPATTPTAVPPPLTTPAPGVVTSAAPNYTGTTLSRPGTTGPPPSTTAVTTPTTKPTTTTTLTTTTQPPTTTTPPATTTHT